MAELLLAEKVGFTSDSIMFTSNNTPANEYVKAFELGAIINLDDITQIDYMLQALDGKVPSIVSLRYNPGPLKGGNAIIGVPSEAKFGLTRVQLTEGYNRLRALGVARFGLHCMVASNELSPEYFAETASILFSAAAEIISETGITIELVNLGGGIGIPYRPEDRKIDMPTLASLLATQYLTYFGDRKDIRVVTECGRVVTGPYGVLLTRAVHSKSTYKEYIGVDASMANLMRPGIYGAYHHVTVLDDNYCAKSMFSPHLATYDIVGSLCENNDKFVVDRQLPSIKRGDLLVIHDTGAHGHSMGFNYNGKLRSAEYLLLNNEIKCIRRAETYDDLFTTIVGFNQ
eukprot:gene1469-1706_t